MAMNFSWTEHWLTRSASGFKVTEELRRISGKHPVVAQPRGMNGSWGVIPREFNKCLDDAPLVGGSLRTGRNIFRQVETKQKRYDCMIPFNLTTNVTSIVSSNNWMFHAKMVIFLFREANIELVLGMHYVDDFTCNCLEVTHAFLRGKGFGITA